MLEGYVELKAIKAIDSGHIIENAELKKTKPSKECSYYGCTNHISMCKGDGESILCVDHQSTLREWGGFARLDRPYSLYKKKICDRCGFDPFVTPDYKYLRADYQLPLAMQILDVDHIVPPTNKKDKVKIDHPCNHPNNLQTLCKNCHASKTQKSGDFSNKN